MTLNRKKESAIVHHEEGHIQFTSTTRVSNIVVIIPYLFDLYKEKTKKPYV
ncbi:hypothetical protein [Neobacillus massiliamazoniensis]|uniref:hypothetical protein n=1 Tax=Neobacillus massiliamazoniensis TaxID=1499688 RepID=UPI00159EF0BF|nr:hypothetical protein [Neobacillus massiliamazoniensis]